MLTSKLLNTYPKAKRKATKKTVANSFELADKSAVTDEVSQLADYRLLHRKNRSNTFRNSCNLFSNRSSNKCCKKQRTKETIRAKCHRLMLLPSPISH